MKDTEKTAPLADEQLANAAGGRNNKINDIDTIPSNMPTIIESSYTAGKGATLSDDPLDKAAGGQITPMQKLVPIPYSTGTATLRDVESANSASPSPKVTPNSKTLR